MSDLIDRQDLIISFKLDDDGTAWSMDEIIYRLEQFPSTEEMQQFMHSAHHDGLVNDGQCLVKDLVNEEDET